MHRERNGGRESSSQIAHRGRNLCPDCCQPGARGMIETSGLWPDGGILGGPPSLMGDSHSTPGHWGCCLALTPPSLLLDQVLRLHLKPLTAGLADCDVLL